MLSAIGTLLAAFGPPLAAWIQFRTERDGRGRGQPREERRQWVIPLATAAWIIAIALSFTLIIAILVSRGILASRGPIMGKSLVTTARVVIGLISVVSMSSGATSIAIALRTPPSQDGKPRPDIVRGACYVAGGLVIIVGMLIIS